MRYLTPTSEGPFRSRSLLYTLLLILLLVIAGVGIGGMSGFKEPSVAIPLIVGIAVLIATLIKPEVGLLFLIFMAPLPWFHYFYVIPARSMTLENLLFVTVFLAWILQISTSRKREFVKSPFNIIILLYFLVNLIACLRPFYLLSGETAFWNIYNYFSWMRGVFIYFFVVNIIKTEKHAKQCILVMGVSIIIVVIMAFSGAFIETETELAPFARAYTPATGDSNTTAAFLALFTPIFIGLMLFSNSKAYKLFLITLSGLCLYAIMTTYSRSGYVAITAGLLCLFAIKDRRALVVLIIILILSPLWLPETVKYRIFAYTFRPGGVIETGRTPLWQTSFQCFLQHPIFGIGYAAVSAHSLFLDTVMRLGLIGLSIYILLFVMAFRYGWYVFKNGTSKCLQGLGLGFFATTVVVVVHGIVAHSLLLGPLRYYFFTLLALIVVAKEVLLKNTMTRSNTKT